MSKLSFASSEWVVAARAVLEELVEKHGEDGTTFSVCEIFTNAPAEIADGQGRVVWHFVIDGTKVTVGEGKIKGADHHVKADYQQALPIARLVYTDEMIAKARKREAAAGQQIPPYLVELHNRMAELTA